MRSGFFRLDRLEERLQRVVRVTGLTVHAGANDVLHIARGRCRDAFTVLLEGLRIVENDRGDFNHK